MTAEIRTEHPHVVMTPDVCGGRPRVAGTRIAVDHVHGHVMPRQAGDGLLRVYPRRLASTPRAELDAQADAVRNALAR